MPVYFDYEHEVQPGEIDSLGHANNVAYFGWMQSAAIEHSRVQGWGPADYQKRGWAWMVRTHQIEYRRPALVGDVVRIQTWVADMTRFTSRRKFAMYRRNQLLARAETNWAFVDLRQGKLLAIPFEVSSAFEIPNHSVAEKEISGRSAEE